MASALTSRKPFASRNLSVFPESASELLSSAARSKSKALWPPSQACAKKAVKKPRRNGLIAAQPWAREFWSNCRFLERLCLLWRRNPEPDARCARSLLSPSTSREQEPTLVEKIPALPMPKDRSSRSSMWRPPAHAKIARLENLEQQR